MIFIDWITIQQDYPEGDLPIIAKSLNTSKNFETQEIDYQFVTPKTVEGSHDTSIEVRCSGTRVYLSGNVGRLARSDNVFNLDLDATLQKCNEILAMFDLPPFTAGEHRLNSNPTADDIKNGIWGKWTGAVISRLDVTCNFVTGSPDAAMSVINWLDGQTVSRMKKSRVGPTTINWGKIGSRVYNIIYIKADEMLDHCKNQRERDEMMQTDAYKYCNENGIVRFEVKLSRLKLKEKHCRNLGEITMDKVVQLYKEESEILKRVKVDQEIVDITSLPQKVQPAALIYLRGDDPKMYFSRPTFYRHAKILREYGIDIAGKRENVVQTPVCIKYIDIQPAKAPEWYDLYPKLELVS